MKIRLLVIIGAVASLAHGCIRPLFVLFFGDVSDRMNKVDSPLVSLPGVLLLLLLLLSLCFSLFFYSSAARKVTTSC